MYNIRNFTCEDNPRTATAQVARPALDTWTGVAAGLLLLAAEYLAAIPQRIGNRLFAMNDAEAGWRGWQAINAYGGLGRRYRDPRFDLLGECPQCLGTGTKADQECPACLGTGRLADAELGLADWDSGE
jgi:hypothetical protein